MPMTETESQEYRKKRGQEIKELREYLCLSQEKFGALVHVSLNTINSWELGKTMPNQSSEHRLSEIKYMYERATKGM